jgi:ABC-type oligopeptide transport system substrate-binding subunit/DNA-binding SARP family transcriptional activator
MLASGERLSFTLLGGFRVECSCRSDLQVRQARLQQLLAYLLLHRASLPTRHQLAFAFWPDTTERQALANLRTLLHRLRESFPELPHYLECESELLTWRDNVAVDIHEFEAALADGDAARQNDNAELEESHLHRAIGWYRGELLPDYYDDWVAAERDRLRERYLAALERLALLLAGRRKYAEAAGHAQALLQADALRESGYRLLMEIRLAEGDRASALRAFHTCVGLLRRELGVDPDPQTQALHQRILRLSQLGEAPAARGAGALPFVGRHEEWRRLVACWRETVAGKAQAVLLTGEAGAGRTRLAEAFLAFARQQGSITAIARCIPTSRHLAYAPVADWFRSNALAAQLKQAPRQQAAEVLRLVEPASAAEPKGGAADTWGPRRLWEAVTAALLGRSRAPVTLLIDDAHWCDAWTLNWLTYAFRLAPRAPLLVLMSARGDELDENTALDAVRLSLDAAGAWSDLPIHPLGPDATAELARHVTGGELSDAAATRLQRITAGNPLFLIEMLRADPAQAALVEQPTGELPDGECPSCPENIALTPRLDAVMRQRLERLSETARALAQTAAVIGQPFSLALLLQTSGLTEEALLPALDDLWQRQVIREHGNDRYDFAHELLRAAVHRSVGPLRRKALHRAIAGALEQLPDERGLDSAAALARHWSLGGDPVRAATCWSEAGDRQRLLLAEGSAATYYRRAGEGLAAARKPEAAARAYMKAGLASQSAYDFAGANKAYDAAFKLWQQSYPPHGFFRSGQRTLRSHWSEPSSLDPALGADFMSTALLTQLFSGLACHGHNREVTPELAAGWEVQLGGRRYVIHLRRDALWNDGAPVTARDFEVAWKRVLEPATDSGNAQLLYDIAGARDYHAGTATDTDALGVAALDDWTLVVDLETPAPHFPQLLAHPVTLPVPRHALTGGADSAAAASAPGLSKLVTNGPFMLADWERGVSLRAVRNPRYGGRWHGNVEAVHLSLDIPAGETLRLYDADELDVIRLSGDYSMGELQHAQLAHGDELRSGPRLVTWHLGFDTTQPPFDDARVRRALALTCDRERIAHAALKGLFTPADGGFVPPGMPGHSPDIALQFDPREARRLLAEAGYAGGDGFPVVTLLTDNLAGDVIEFMAAEWQQRLGIAVRTISLPWGEFLQRMTGERQPIYYAAWRADYPDPDTFLRSGLRWHQTQWHDPEYERLLAQARSAANSRERLARYTAVDRRLVESAAVVPVVYGWTHLLLKPRVRRYPFSGIRPWFWTEVVIED